MKRKSLLVLIAAIGLTAMVGMGTYAEFSDVENSGTQSIAAGTLDLTVGGGATDTAPIAVTNAAPGDSGSALLTVTNAGTIAGAKLTVIANRVAAADQEGTCTEAEKDEGDEDAAIESECTADSTAADTGELDDVMTVEIKDGATTLFSGTLAQWVTNGAEDTAGLAASGARQLTINWAVPTSAGNEIQDDEAGFTLSFVLEQIA